MTNHDSINNIEQYLIDMEITKPLEIETMLDELIKYHKKEIVNGHDFVQLVMKMRTDMPSAHQILLKYRRKHHVSKAQKEYFL